MKSLNVKQSLSLTKAVRQPVTSKARDPSRAANAPPIKERPLLEPSILDRGFNIPANCGLNSESQPQLRITPPPAPTSGTTGPITEHLASGSSSTRVGSNQPINSREMASEAARQRVVDRVELSRPQKKPRKQRTCAKCAVPSCPGKKSVSSCKGNCQDCASPTCRGRNAKRPTAPCHRAWDSK